MSKNILTDRQVMLDSCYEFYYCCDDVPYTADFHQHAFYEIFFLLSGGVSYSVEGKIYHLRPGDLLMTGSLDIHRPEVSSGQPYECFVIRISDSFFDTVCPCGDDLGKFFADATSGDYHLIRPDSSGRLKLKTICEHISEAQKDNLPGSRTLAASYMLQFAVYLSRCRCEAPSSFAQDVSENKNICRIIAYINKNIRHDLSLDEIAGRFSISKFYLCKQFRHFTGMSVYQYIMKKRLAVSLRMLRRGTSVSSAYCACGFNDYSNYLKAFKREFGKTPKEFLKVTG